VSGKRDGIGQSTWLAFQIFNKFSLFGDEEGELFLFGFGFELADWAVSNSSFPCRNMWEMRLKRGSGFIMTHHSLNGYVAEVR